MRRLAILLALVATVSASERIALPGARAGIVKAPRRVRRALMRLADWRAFLIGPIRLFQRAAPPGALPWLNRGN